MSKTLGAVAVCLRLSVCAVMGPGRSVAAAEPGEEPMVVIPALAGQVHGRVLFEGNDIRQPPVPGKHVKVRLTDRHGANLIAETITDREGNFTLTIKKDGEYVLRIGRLKIRVRVKTAEAAGPVTPKKMLFVVPRQLAR